MATRHIRKPEYEMLYARAARLSIIAAEPDRKLSDRMTAVANLA
jgi:hypothetical protein